MRRKAPALIAILSIAAAALWALYYFNVIPHAGLSNADFGIEPYVSELDADGDGIDDQTDILNGVREYIATKPKYKSKYYSSGYPDDGFGVCTDVVAFGLRAAGYDLMELVDRDILAAPDAYGIASPDKNIDFRRVRNLRVYFARNAISLTTDLSEIGEWQGGDIVIFKDHIGIVSDVRDAKGIPFLIHHASPTQLHYEEDVLPRRADEITGHYRMS